MRSTQRWWDRSRAAYAPGAVEHSRARPGLVRTAVRALAVCALVMLLWMSCAALAGVTMGMLDHARSVVATWWRPHAAQHGTQVCS